MMLPETGRRYSFFIRSARTIRGPLCADCLNGDKYMNMLRKLENDRDLLLYEHEQHQFTFRCFSNLLRENGCKPFRRGRSTGIALTCSDAECGSPNAPPDYLKDSIVQTEVGYLGTSIKFYSNDNSTTRIVKGPVNCPLTRQRFSYLNLDTLDMRGPYCSGCINDLFLKEVKALHSAGNILIVEHQNVGCRTRSLMSFQMMNLVDPAERPFIASLVPESSQPCVSDRCYPKENKPLRSYIRKAKQVNKSSEVSTMPAVRYGFGVDLDSLLQIRSPRKKADLMNETNFAPSELTLTSAAYRPRS